MWLKQFQSTQWQDRVRDLCALKRLPIRSTASPVLANRMSHSQTLRSLNTCKCTVWRSCQPHFHRRLTRSVFTVSLGLVHVWRWSVCLSQATEQRFHPLPAHYYNLWLLLVTDQFTHAMIQSMQPMWPVRTFCREPSVRVQWREVDDEGDRRARIVLQQLRTNLVAPCKIYLLSPG